MLATGIESDCSPKNYTLHNLPQLSENIGWHKRFKFNNSIVPNKVRIGWPFSSNKYAYRDVYSALKGKRRSN